MASLRDRAVAALMSGDYQTAEALFSERLELAIAVGNGVSTSACRLNLASIANKTGRRERAEALLSENLSFVRSKGQARCEAHTLAALAETELYRGYRDAGDAIQAAALALQIRDNPLTLHSLELFAASAASAGDVRRAATVLAATETARESTGLEPDDDDAVFRKMAFDALGDRRDAVADAWEIGRHLDLTGALEVARLVTIGLYTDLVLRGKPVPGGTGNA